jgi:hypothetical protein
VTAPEALAADPVFQLNTLLWSLEDLPDAGEITPVLRNAGYYLVAIGRRVIMPVDPSEAAGLAEAVGSKDRTPAHPDLWLRHENDSVQPILELKAHGFSADSSNATQAMKLLAASGDLGPSVGANEPEPGHVIYVTVDHDAEPLAGTLVDLRGRLKSLELSPAPSGVIGLTWVGNAIALMSPRPRELPAPAAAVLTGPRIVLQPDDAADEARPLYLVPWIPGNEDSQDPELHADGLRELTARLLTCAIAAIGRARAPATIAITGGDLLEQATYGVFARWRDADREKFGRAAAMLVYRALRSTEAASLDGQRLEIDVPNAEIQDAAIDRLGRADPSDPSKNLQAAIDEPPTLFELAPETAPVLNALPPAEE